MEIYSPPKGTVTKLSRNVLRSEAEKEAKKPEAEADSIKMKFEKQHFQKKAAVPKKAASIKRDSFLKKAINSCYGYVNDFFYEEVV